MSSDENVVQENLAGYQEAANHVSQEVTSSHLATKSSEILGACNKFAGTLYAASSSFFFSLQAICMKSVFSIAPYEMTIVQSGLQAIPSGAALLWQRKNPFTSIIARRSGWKMVLRGIFGGAVVMLRIIALRYLPIGDCSVILFSSPMFVALLAPFLLKEPITKYIMLALLFTVAGLLLVTQPEFLFGHQDTVLKPDGDVITSYWRTVGIMAGLGGAVTGAGISLVLRSLKGENEHVVMFWYGCTAVVLASTLTAAMRDFRWPSFDWPFILLAGVFQYLSQITQTLAFQRDSAASVALVRTTEIVWAYLWQVIWFKEAVSWISIGGAVFVLVSVTLVSYERYRLIKREKLLNAMQQQPHGADAEQQVVGALLPPDRGSEVVTVAVDIEDGENTVLTVPSMTNVEDKHRTTA